MQSLEMVLPSGPIGLVLVSSSQKPPIIKHMKESSPLCKLYPELTAGMKIDTLTLEDGTTQYCMTGHEFTSLLKQHATSTKRIVRVIGPNDELTNRPEEEVDTDDDDEEPVVVVDENHPPGVLLLELKLPAGNIGLVFTKNSTSGQPQIKEIKKSSPLLKLYPSLKTGMLVDALMLEDGTKHDSLNNKTLRSLLKKHCDSEGRVLRVVVVVESQKHTTTAVIPQKPVVDDDDDVYESCATTADTTNMPPELFCSVPAGPLGMHFVVVVDEETATPPKIQSLDKDSCLREYGVVPGMVVDTLELEETGSRHYELSSGQLTKLLDDHADADGRLLCFINPDLVNLTPTPQSIDEEEDNTPLEIHAHLPAGPLGAAFAQAPDGGGDRLVITITELDDDSCLRDFDVCIGMMVDTLTLQDGMVYYATKNMESLDHFMDVLQDHLHEEGKILRFVHPDHSHLLTLAPRYDGPDEVTCKIPSNDLGMSVNGTPPIVFRLTEHSPLHDEGVVVGMKIDTITLDGVKYYEMDHWELMALLKDYQDSPNRIIRFVAPHYVITPPPIPNSIDIRRRRDDDNDELEVELPCGCLGLTFTNPTTTTTTGSTEPVCIKTVRADSELVSYHMDGYGIHRIRIPGRKIEQTHNNTNNRNQVMALLSETQHIKGRVLYLKKMKLYYPYFGFDDDDSVSIAENDNECHQQLLDLGFETRAIQQSIQYVRRRDGKSKHELIDTNDVISHIIEEAS